MESEFKPVEPAEGERREERGELAVPRRPILPHLGCGEERDHGDRDPIPRAQSHCSSPSRQPVYVDEGHDHALRSKTRPNDELPQKCLEICSGGLGNGYLSLPLGVARYRAPCREAGRRDHVRSLHEVFDVKCSVRRFLAVPLQDGVAHQPCQRLADAPQLVIVIPPPRVCRLPRGLLHPGRIMRSSTVPISSVGGEGLVLIGSLPI
mmetsp:Transcript_26425/g.49376  ORF Transcript_26425/g.49376 Transcript_26425/m.49376 type:complete len:207 (+) Transcript_26425:951-1571(+)